MIREAKLVFTSSAMAETPIIGIGPRISVWVRSLSRSSSVLAQSGPEVGRTVRSTCQRVSPMGDISSHLLLLLCLSSQYNQPAPLNTSLSTSSPHTKLFPFPIVSYCLALSDVFDIKSSLNTLILHIEGRFFLKHCSYKRHQIHYQFLYPVKFSYKV